MVEEQDVELTSSFKNIKNTSMSRTIHVEHLLNANRRHRTSKKARKPHKAKLGQGGGEGQNRKKGERGSRKDLSPREGIVREKMVPRPGTPFHWPGDQPEGKGDLTAQEERAASSLQEKKLRVSCAVDQQCSAASPALPSCPGPHPKWLRAERKLRIQKSD